MNPRWHFPRDWIRQMKRNQQLLGAEKLFKLVKKDEIINGMMLSDACIIRPKSKFSHPRFQLIQKKDHEQLCEKVRGLLQDYGFNTFLYSHNSKYMWKGIAKFAWKTMCYSGNEPVWTLMREYWYPDGVKIVPKDLNLTAKTLAYLMMGDGCCSKMASGTNKFCIRLCVEGFSENDVRFLASKIEELGIDKVKITSKTHGGKRITIYASKEVEKFLNLVEPYTLPIFMYKMKHPLVRTHLEANKDPLVNQKRSISGKLDWQKRKKEKNEVN